MKNIITILIPALLLQFAPLQGFELPALQENKTTPVEDSTLMTKVVIGKNLVSVQESDAGVQVKVLDKDISILESLEGKKNQELESHDNGSEGNEMQMDTDSYEEVLPDTPEDYQEDSDENAGAGELNSDDLNCETLSYYRDRHHETDDWDKDYWEKDDYRSSRDFRGHLSGVNFGFNGYLFDESSEMPEEISYMESYTGKSFGGSVFFAQADIGLSRHIGFVTGAGITWNNYFFKRQNSITEGDEGTIIEVVPGESAPVKKSKFSTLYLEVPLLLEVQIPAGYSKRLNVAAGVTGGLRLNAWTKMVFKDGEKVRSNGDFNLNLLRAGATARVGFENFMLYGTYYLTPWFHDLKGPEGLNLVPFEIGLAFTIND